MLGIILLDQKRTPTGPDTGNLKARGVKQGNLDTSNSDPEGFNYNAQVASREAVRAVLATSPREYDIAIADVSTAFLQSDKFPPTIIKYVKFPDPLGGKTTYWRQCGPLYGEASAPTFWSETIAPWIQQQGFVRGKNDTCIYHHPERDLVILLYVDDLLLNGKRMDIDWFYEQVSARFRMKPLEVLTPDHGLDYLGMAITYPTCPLPGHGPGVYLSMEEYTNHLVSFMQVDQPGRENMIVSYPFNSNIDEDDTPLSPSAKRQFLTGLGMVGWIASCFRADVAYAYSAIGQSMANPTQKAFQQLLWVVRYLKGTPRLAAFVPARQGGVPNRWRFFTDSDQGADQSPQNKGRSRSGCIAMCNGFPVSYKSKTTSVAMAHPGIKAGGHADVSSAACEIYAAANATMEFLRLSYIADEIGRPVPMPFELEMDNAAAEVFAKNTAANTRLRHIDQRQHWVTTLRDSNIVTPKHVDTKSNVADIFTKPLTGDIFRTLRSKFLVDLTD